MCRPLLEYPQLHMLFMVYICHVAIMKNQYAGISSLGHDGELSVCCYISEMQYCLTFSMQAAN